MLVTSRTAWRGHPRGTILDVDDRDRDVLALIDKGRLRVVNATGTFNTDDIDDRTPPDQDEDES